MMMMMMMMMMMILMPIADRTVQCVTVRSAEHSLTFIVPNLFLGLFPVKQCSLLFSKQIFASIKIKMHYCYQY